MQIFGSFPLSPHEKPKIIPVEQEIFCTIYSLFLLDFFLFTYVFPYFVPPLSK